MSSSLSGGTAYVDVALGRTTDLQRGVAGAGEQAADTAKSSFLSRVGSIALGGALGNALTTGISSAFSFGKEAVFGFNSELQQATIGFTTMLGSSKAAGDYISQLQTFAKTTPFEFGNLVQNAQQMMGMGIAAKDVIPDLTALGDSVASIGGSASQVDSVTLAFDQMNAKGTLDMGNMNQLMQNGVPTALKILADHYKVTTGAMIQMISTGKVQSSEALPALVSGIEKGTKATAALGGMMDKQSYTMAGALSNIKDSATQAIAGAFKPLFESASTAAQGLANFLGSDAISNASKKINTSLTGAFKDISGAIGGVRRGWSDMYADLDSKSITERIGAQVKSSVMLIGNIGTGFKRAYDYGGPAGSIMEDIGQKARFAWDAAKPIAQDLWVKIQSGVQTVGPILKTLFLDKLDALKTIARDAYPIIVNLAKGIGPVLGQELRAAADLVTQHLLPAFLKFSQFVQQQVIPRAAELVAFTEQHLIPIFQQVGEVISKKVMPEIGRLADLFVQKVLPALQPVIKDGFAMLQEAIAKLTPIAQNLISWFEQSALPVLENIANVLVGRIIPFVLQVADVLIRVLRPAFDVVVVIMRDVVVPILKWTAENYLGMMKTSADMASGVISAVHGIGDVFTWLWDKIVSPYFKLYGDSVRGLGTAFHDVFDGMGKVVSAGFADAVALAKAPINGMINLVNQAIAGLNSINVSIPSWVPGVGGDSFGIDLPKIPTLAAGGLVLPTPGGTVVRVAEAGAPEIVSPIPLMEEAVSRALARRPIGRDAPLIGTVNTPKDMSANTLAELLYGKLTARGAAVG